MTVATLNANDRAAISNLVDMAAKNIISQEILTAAVQVILDNDSQARGMIMTIATEFPDFDYSLPIIAGFADTSWHNDTCPSLSDGRLKIWCDYADEAKREFEGGYRFSVTNDVDDNGGIALIETDDLDQLLAAIQQLKEGSK